MDFPLDPPKLNSFTSLFFGKKPKKPPMQTPTSPSHSHLLLEPGLKTLTSPTTNPNRSLSCIKPNLLSFSSSPSPSSLSPSSSYSSVMDDVKERDNNNHNNNNNSRQVKCETDGIGNGNGEAKEETHEHQYRRSRSFRETREFPPPIPLLARTGNLPCHMPWVLKRFNGNGRLVLQEVKVKHHEFFLAHRANGRLTLQLMHLDESAIFPSLAPLLNPDGVEGEKDREKKEEGNPDGVDGEKEKLKKEEEEEEENPDGVEGEKEKEKKQQEEEESIVDDAEEQEHHLSLPPSSPSSSSTSSVCLEKEKSNQENDSPSMVSDDTCIWGEKRNMLEDSEMGSLPSILSSSLPESSFGIGGNGVGCFASRRSNSPFQMPMSTIRPIHS